MDLDYDVRDAVAIVGMAGRFPGTDSPRALWEHVLAARSCMTEFSDEELLASGVDEATLRDPRFVRTEGFLRDQEYFDAAFFEMPPREAEMLDPQHRIALECAWSALEDAGYTPSGAGGPVGVFGGVGLSSYYIQHVLPGAMREARNGAGALTLMDKDYMVLRISYELDLRGPSIAINTSCSTSLVAAHVATQSLLNGECRLALVGGAHLNPVRPLGYLWQEGSHQARDGVCRPFDHRATGMVGGNGCAFVVLERLEDALERGDFVYAVIRGSAVNNDGSEKVGFAAPGVDGQARVVSEALEVAGVDVETVRYVETHGTGTNLGDPIEVAGLTRAYRSRTTRKGFCALGSVKANIGHLGAAAGVTGLIMAAWAVRTRTIPPLANFVSPNPALRLDQSPFCVLGNPRPLGPEAGPFRAGVSSLGLGGTNAHVVLDEAPVIRPKTSKKAVGAGVPVPEAGPRRYHILPIAAKSEASLNAMVANLERHLETCGDTDVADVAATMQLGRVHFAWRDFLLAESEGEGRLSRVLRPLACRRQAPVSRPRVVFLFPGGGSQHSGMARGLFEREPLFRKTMLEGAEAFRSYSEIDLVDRLYGSVDDSDLQRPSLALPALFLVEYSLAQVLRSWGIEPAALVGHSLGEYTAAALAGVLEPDDAMRLVYHRGTLIETVPKGAMIGVGLQEKDVLPRLGEGLAIAAINGPTQCVVGGPLDAVASLESNLREEGIACHRLLIGAGGHSSLVDPILEPFERVVSELPLKPPTLPYLSNVTGDWVTPEQAQSPSAWALHLRKTVRFAQCVSAVLAEGPAVLMEVGPGTVLSSLARLQMDAERGQHAIACLPHLREDRAADAALMEALGRLWTQGAGPDWDAHRGRIPLRRMPLPTYAFDRKRYWIEASEQESVLGRARVERLSIEDWFWVPVWRPAPLPKQPLSPRNVMSLGNPQGSLLPLRGTLTEKGCEVVQEGSLFATEWREAECAARLRMRQLDGWQPDTVLVDCEGASGTAFVHERLLALARACHQALPDHPLEIVVVSRGWQRVESSDAGELALGGLMGPARVVPFEFQELCLRLVDLDATTAHESTDWESLSAEILSLSEEVEVAYRGGIRSTKDFVRVDLPNPPEAVRGLRHGGTYLITGGLGGVGRVIARHLASSGAKLVLTTRRPFPAEEAWTVMQESPGTDPTLRANLRDLSEIQKEGGHVLVVQADATSVAEMAGAVKMAVARFGPLNGVLHAAGVSEGRIVEQTDSDLSRRVLAPKVDGTEAVWEAVAGCSLDFLLLFSSLSTVTSAYGGADYVTANGYLNQFARLRGGKGTRVVAVAWDAWDGVGMAERARCLNGFCEASHSAIGPRDGCEALERILAFGPSEVVVCTQDLSALRKRNRGINQAAGRTHGGALRAPTERNRYPRPQMSVPYEAPANALERQLVGVWEETLRVAPVGVLDNFFELGGESIVAVQILAKAREVGVTVTAKELFEGPTVRQMALRFPAQKSSEVSAIESERAQGGEPWEAHGLDKDAVVTLLERFPGAEHVMPLTPLQAWMVRESLVEGPHRSYINQAVSEAPGALPAESLRRAFSAVIGRHEALRCAFVMEGAGRPVQVVCRGSEMAVDVLDWSNLDGPDQHDAFGRFLREDRARGVDLLRPPLLRLSILQLSEASSRLVLTGHHAVMDGWSSHRVFDEVRRVMTGGALDGPVIPFRRFVEWLGRRDGGGARAQFSDGLAGYEPVPMLATVSREGEPDAGEPTQGRVASYLGAETSRALQEGARRAQVTQNTVFQAAWARTLARRIGRDDVVFGVTIAGRPESLAGASEIVGQCCSALPLRVRVPERVTPGWLRDLQAENAALRDHAGAAFEEFWSTGKALFDTHMIFESFPSAGGSGQGMGSGGAYVVDGWHMPLRVFVFPGQDAAIALHYDACSLDGAKVASLCDAYVEQLATVVGSLR